MQTNKQRIQRLLLMCYLFFGIVGFILGMRTSIFYYVQETYLSSYRPIANMILISGLCMQVSLYFGGLCIQKFGYKKILNLGLISFIIPLLLMAFVKDFIGFAIIYSLLMLSYGVTVILLNLYVSTLAPERKSNNLMMLHLFFCVGALLGPKWISFFNEQSISWQTVTALTSIPLVIILLLTLKTTGITETQVAGKRAQSEPMTLNTFTLNVLFILVFMSTQVWEYGIGTWFIIFETQAKGLKPENAATLLTLYYAMYPVLRLILFKVIHKFNLVHLIIGSFIYASLLALIGAISGYSVFYSLTGAGVAIMYPAFMALMQENLGTNVEKKVGFITMVGGLLQYVALWSVGLLSDVHGIGFGFNYLIIYLFIGLVGIISVKLHLQRQGQLVTINT